MVAGCPSDQAIVVPGRPDFVKLGRAVFYHKENVAEWIRLNIVPTDPAL